MPMKLYYHPLSTYSQKVLMALYEKEVAFEPNVVNLFDEGVRAEYREVYPLGKIPCVVLDDGHMIPESSIIVEYLDTHFGSGTPLIPAAPDDARQVRFKDRMCDLHLNDHVASLVFERWKPEAQRSREIAERANFHIGVVYRFLERNLAGGGWMHGEHFSMADCAAAPPLSYARQVAPFDAHPNVSAYWERLSARPSFARVAEEAAPHLAKLAERTA